MWWKADKWTARPINSTDAQAAQVSLSQVMPRSLCHGIARAGGLELLSGAQKPTGRAAE